METLQRISAVAGKYFALWVLLGVAVAFFIEPLSGLTAYVNPLLGVVMFGMQNSGLAAGLAATYFGGVAALPGAIFSVWHNISGPLLATY